MWSSTFSSRVILHIDGDAFFASCMQAVQPEYKGLPVVSGRERGIAVAMSYEAKARGITRGMPIHQIKQICPEAIILPTDYETCSLFSKRMFSIMRRYSNMVEEYGIDEGFMDITGLRNVHKMSYQDLADTIRQDVERELSITVSVGLAPTKVLAKIASKHNKPNGLTVISHYRIHEFLKQLPATSIWGVGKNTAAYMQQLGIHTAQQFAEKPFYYIKKHFTKPHQEIWRELSGESIYPVITEEKTSFASISKTRTFASPSANKEFVYAQLLKNVENACIKARQYNLVTKKIVIFLKTQTFRVKALETTLPRSSAYPNDLTPLVKELFDALYQKDTVYRTTGITLTDLTDHAHIQQSLFESSETLAKMEQVYTSIDTLAGKFGKHTVHLGGSLSAHKSAQQESDKESTQWKKLTDSITGSTSHLRLNIPMLALQLK